jgi:hypothetical protein
MNVWGIVVRFPITEKDYFSPKHTDRSKPHSFSYLIEYKSSSHEVKLEQK